MSLIRKIPANRLRIGMYLHKLGGAWLRHPFLRNSFLLTDPKDIAKILAAGIAEVWIDESRGELLDLSAADNSTEIEEHLASSAEETSISEDACENIKQDGSSVRSVGPTSLAGEYERAREICLAGKQQVKALFDELRMGNSIQQADVVPLVEEIADSVLRNPSALISVARLKTHDDYTYLHSVAVSALMLALAKQLGLDAEQTRIAGIGGLMHDFGKAFMPLDVLNKPGKLTDDEYAIMKSHPGLGARVLQDAGTEIGVVDIALHHHEKMNGQGYPHGLKDTEITLLSRMGAICDVYDAVTSVRAYKTPWDPAGAMREMARWNGHFDKRVFNAFVKTVGIYPIGAVIRLASDRLAVVAEPNATSLLKPKVRVFFSLRLKEKILIQSLDLADPACNDSIVGPENPEKWGFTNLETIWL